MKGTAILLTILFSASIFSGCMGDNSSAEEEGIITDLQNQVDSLKLDNQQQEDDINSLNEQLSSSSTMISEIESLLNEANSSIEQLTSSVMQKNSQIASLSNLSEQLRSTFENSTEEDSSQI